MSLFYTESKRIIKPRVEQYGFKTYGRFFYRVVGDILQEFCILGLNRECTIRFFVKPLCGVEYRDIEGNFELSYLYGKRVEWIYYDPRDIESIRNAAEILANGIEKYLIPWFLKTETVESAYEESCNLALEIACSTVWVDSRDYFLKFGRYEEVAKSLEKGISGLEERKQQELKETEVEPEKKEDFLRWLNNKYKRIEKHKELLKLINENDEKGIENIIKRREEEALKILKWKRK